MSDMDRRYVDVDWLIDDLKLKDHVPLEDEDAWVVIDWLNKFPTVDAVEVVRCKDCKYFQTYPPTDEQDYTIYDCERLSYCTDTAVSNQPNDYCSRGVRKDGR